MYSVSVLYTDPTGTLEVAAWQDVLGALAMFIYNTFFHKDKPNKK